jgi:seryl-tRNA synthetase
MGRKDIEDVLKRLDKLTQEKARMAAAHILRLTHGVKVKVKVIDDNITGVRTKMKDVDNKMDTVLNGMPNAPS